MKNVLYFLFGFFITSFFIEIYFQISEIETPLIVYYDDNLGRKYLPNKKESTFNEGFSLSKTNNSGYFFPNFAPKGKNDISISLIGDSYINGRYIFDRHHIRNLLEENLNLTARNGTSFRVLKFGQVGGNISDFYIWYKKESNLFNNEITFIFIDNADFVVEPQNLSPFCELIDSTISINYSFLKSKKYNFQKKILPLSKSSLFWFAYKCYKKRDLLRQIIINSNSDIDKKIEKPETYLTELNKRIITELSDNKVIFVFKYEIHQSIINYFIENNIYYIDLYPLFLNMKKNGVDPTYWKATKKTGHWNQQAHEAVGKYLAEKIYKTMQENPDYQYKFK